MAECKVEGFIIRPWNAEQLIEILPLIGDLIKQSKNPTELGFKVFTQAPLIISITLGRLTAEDVGKWVPEKVSTVMLAIFRVNTEHFQKIAQRNITATA